MESQSRNSRSIVHLDSATSSEINHPWAIAPVSYGCLLTGGGAWDKWDGYGNMITHSYPEGDTWQVGGKDHYRPDPSRITAYSIGIENIYFPNVGYLEVKQNPQWGPPCGGFCTGEWETADSTVITCSGGKTTWLNYGRMLVYNFPTPWTLADVASKDCVVGDYGVTSVYTLGIRVKP